MESVKEEKVSGTFLDVAASRLQSGTMALLLKYGFIQWVGSEDNNQVFISLIEDYMTLRSARCSEKCRMGKIQECRMEVLKYEAHVECRQQSKS